ncbi:MAG: hypothetical protein J1E82_05420 [Muribaculaceae bacterium]|nr:hypothetical protein [Muribaculaceae bacterium]
MGDILNKLFKRRPGFLIDSRETLEEAAVKFGILPFFPNNIRGLSVEEMCAPGMLFGGNYDEGCWEWKGPVVRRHTTAYGKFFRRKAGFVALELLPDFLNYRRKTYPVKPESTEELLLDIIRENEGLSSTDLKAYIFGGGDTKREWNDIPDPENTAFKPAKRKSLEGPLQRLQMGGWIIISDFVYKRTKKGERYGWGVATYSTPELTFGSDLILPSDKSPEESLETVVSRMKDNWPAASRKSLLSLLQ